MAPMRFSCRAVAKVHAINRSQGSVSAQECLFVCSVLTQSVHSCWCGELCVSLALAASRYATTLLGLAAIVGLETPIYLEAPHRVAARIQASPTVLEMAGMRGMIRPYISSSLVLPDCAEHEFWKAMPEYHPGTDIEIPSACASKPQNVCRVVKGQGDTMSQVRLPRACQPVASGMPFPTPRPGPRCCS